MNPIRTSTTPPKLSSPGDVLARTEHFNDLPSSTLEALVGAAETCQVKTGGVLFRAGDPFGNVIYILCAGRMRRYYGSGEQDDITPGSIIGLNNYVERVPFSSTVEAVTDCALLGITAEALERLEHEYPSLANTLHRIISHKLRDRAPIRDIHRGALAQPVRNIMTSPIASCTPQLRLREALTLMRERDIGSVVVTENAHAFLGIVTRADLADAVLVQNAQPDDMLRNVGWPPPRTVDGNTPLWKVQDIQQQQRAKYVVVLEENRPIGVVSQTDIVRTLIASPGTLASDVRQAATLQELVALKGQLADEAAYIRETHRRASDAVPLVSDTHLAIERRVIELTLDTMKHQGAGEPPVPFVVLVMGSGGRREMLLNPDQDNGLILADTPEAERQDVQAWFTRFAERMNANLAEVGYALCPGDIMARNPMYRHTLSQWQRQVERIVSQPSEESARWSNTVFDFATLYGDDSLTTALRQHALAAIHARPGVLTRMAADDARARPALGFFHQLVATTRDASGARIDLKRQGMRLIVDAARIFALQAGVTVQHTPARLEALVRAGTVSSVLSTSVIDAYDVILDFLLAHQIEQAQKGLQPDPWLDLKALTEQQRVMLRLAMRIVKRFQDHLQAAFGAPHML